MTFSGALTLTDLDDFLAPSQACILPVRQTNKAANQADGTNADTEIHIDENNNYYEVAIAAKPRTAADPPTLRFDGSTEPHKSSDGNAAEALVHAVGGIQALEGGVEKPPAVAEALQKAEISLNDCLACSGCVTSTESMLITLQSHLEVQAYIDAHTHDGTTPALDKRTGILSISPQTLASLCASYASTTDKQTPTPRRLLRRIRRFLSARENGGWAGVWDTTFARHLSLLEHVKEFKERRAAGKGRGMGTGTGGDVNPDGMTKLRGTVGLPMLASACPGWVCYAEKAHGELLGYVSATRSSQGVMGALVKQWWGGKNGRMPTDSLGRPNEIYHVTVMPCYDKKLEASRSDFYSSVYQTRDVDCVLTTGELDLLLRERGFDPFAVVPGEDEDETETAGPFPELLQHPGTSSGSYLHALLGQLSAEHPTSTTLVTRPIRGSEDHVEFLLVDVGTGEIIFKGAKCYGFRNLQNLVRKVGKETGVKGTSGRAGAGGKLAAAVAARRRAGRGRAAAGANAATDTAPSSGASTPVSEVSPDDRTLDYVEVMACPGGCVNGGGQMKPSAPTATDKADVEGEKDEEGYPRVWDLEGVETRKPVIDESMRWSTKAWVAKVESIYWSGLPTPPASPPPTTQTTGSLKPFDSLQELHDLSSLPEFAQADALAKQIIVETCAPEDGTYAEVMDDEAESRRWEFLRTRYREVESDVGQMTASAVKW